MTATAGNAQVSLSWTAYTLNPPTSYEVQQSSTGSSGPWSQIATTVPAVRIYTQSGLTNGTSYYFRVRAYAVLKGVSTATAWSNIASATPVLPPAPTGAPASFTAVAGNAQVSLSWGAVAGATFYNIWRKVGNGPFPVIQVVNGTSWVDTTVTNGTTYTYAVNAGNAGGTANAFSYLDATPLLPLPPIPPTPTGLSATSSNGYPVSLYWNAVLGATSYDVFRSTTSGSGYSLKATVTANSWSDTTTSNGVPYYYVVTAKYNGVSSAYSNQASVTPLATPTGFTVIPGTSTCFLSWNPVAGATSYVVSGTYTYLYIGYIRSRVYFSNTVTATNYLANFYMGSDAAPGYGQIFSVQAINSNASSATAEVNASKAAFDSNLNFLSLAPTTVHGIDASTGTVTLTNVAPSNGAKVNLTSDNAAVALPVSVTIPSGATSATFPITTTAVATQQAATISAFYAGLTKAATLTLAVNRAPVAVADNVVTTQGVTIDIPVLNNDSDADGDTLNVIAVSQGSKGATSINANKTIRYVPTAGALGSDSFSYTINDGHGATASAIVTMTINVGNRAPVANAQSVTTNEDTSKAIVLSATDADGNALTYSVVTPPTPTKGTLSGIAPNLTYTPNLNFNGTDNFTFKANDGTVDSNVAAVSITITPVNDAPVANAQSISATKNTAFNGTLTATDVDSTTLTYSKVSDPAHGTVTVASNGAFIYTPAPDYLGSDSFTFKANDGALDSLAAAVSITVNSPPSGILSTLRFAPTSVVGGGGRTALGTLMLTSAAPSGGLVVSISSDNVAAQVLTSVPFAAGESSKQFTVTTSAVSSVTNANIKATSGSASITTVLPVTPRFAITNINNGDVLKGYAKADVTVYDSTFVGSETTLKLDGVAIGRFNPTLDASAGNNLVSLSIPTQCFSNGSHIVSAVGSDNISDLRTVSFSNAISALQYDNLFDISLENTDAPTACRIRANVNGASTWTLKIKDDSSPSVTVKTYTGTGATIDITWNGTSDSGVVQPEGSYQIVFSSDSNLNVLGHYLTAQASGGDSFDYVVGITNKHKYSDSLVILNIETCGGMAAAVNYAKYIRTMVAAKRFQSFNFPCYPILVDTGDLNTPGGNAIIGRINKEFGLPKKLIYVCSHGGIEQTGFTSGVPNFGLGVYSWASNYAPIITSSSANNFNVRTLVAPIGYGDSTDPPKLVWMDNCNSGGGLLFDPTLPSFGESTPPNGGGLDTQWADCFGIQSSNGYEGVFLGVSGYGFFHRDNTKLYSWEMWERQLWSSLMVDSENFQTAYQTANQQTPFQVSINRSNPQNRYR